jgi:putative hydrolase
MKGKALRLEADLHTHSVASKDGFSTVREMAASAGAIGLKMLGITDHSPQTDAGASICHFLNMLALPHYIEGVELLRGVEANIMDNNGTLDLPVDVLRSLNLVLAGFHGSPGYVAGSVEDNTRAMIAAIKNPYVHVITHPGNPQYPIDAEKVVMAAKTYGKVLEINNKSFRERPGSTPCCQMLAWLVRKHGVVVAIDSDAHFADSIGHCETALALAESVGIDEDYVLNTSAERVRDFLAQHRLTTGIVTGEEKLG